MAKAVSREAFQLQVTLLEIDPPIWRRVLVPGHFDLAKLHRVIQEAFGWLDYHLHVFQIRDTDYGEPDPEAWRVLQSERITLAKLGLQPGETFSYEYDFGDSWIHEITVEKVLVQEEPLTLPVCLAGERACPIEDSGGAWGYQDMIRNAQDPDHPEYEELQEYLGPAWDAEAFDLDAVNARLKAAFTPRSRSKTKATADNGALPRPSAEE